MGYCMYPTVPMEETDGQGSSQFTPQFVLLSLLSIPLYHYCKWTDWDHTKVSHWLHPVPTVYHTIYHPHSSGCLLWLILITLRCYYNKSIYYHCENRLVVLTTKGLFHHSESHSHTSILVRFDFAFQEIGCSKLAIHFSRSPLCPYPLLC